MLALIAGIAGLIALGNLVSLVIALTFSWLVGRIKQKFAEKNAKKVAVADLDKLIASCSNTVSFNQLEQLNEVSNEGYTHLMAAVNDNGEVYDVEVIRDTNENLDEEVARFINKTDEGMVVINN